MERITDEVETYHLPEPSTFAAQAVEQPKWSGSSSAALQNVTQPVHDSVTEHSRSSAQLRPAAVCHDDGEPPGVVPDVQAKVSTGSPKRLPGLAIGSGNGVNTSASPITGSPVPDGTYMHSHRSRRMSITAIPTPFARASMTHATAWEAEVEGNPLPLRSQDREHSETARENWNRSVSKVQTMGSIARQFRTLRDMQLPFEIPREQIKVIKVLGKGAFAIVEQCVYTPGGGRPMVVAVKRLKPDLTQNDIDVKGLVKEVALMKKLRNSHLVEFLGYGHWEFARSHKERQASLFIVEELVDGGNLKQLVARQMHATTTKLYRTADAVRWLLQVAHGLKYLHRCEPQVIHRDLKLENILLKGRTVEAAEAKIADFGLSALVRVTSAYQTTSPLARNAPKPARARRDSVSDLEGAWKEAARRRLNAIPSTVGNNALNVASGYEQLSGRTGTLMYMAPEVYSQQKYNEKADVFSFAIIFYELIHRYMMISATDGSFAECKAYALRVARGFRPPIHDQLPSKVRGLIEACWDPNPSRRPGMDMVAVKLQELLNAPKELEAIDVAVLGVAAAVTETPKEPKASFCACSVM